MWGVIGGSGFSTFDGVHCLETYEKGSITPFGRTSTSVKKMVVDGHEFLFISRHGDGHHLLPSKVPYCANMWALKSLGAVQVLSLSSVGSLEEQSKPNDIVLPHQYINATKGTRQSTYCDKGVVGHVSLGDPVCAYWQEMLVSLSDKISTNIHAHKTAVVIEGPQFSTRAESLMYQQWGAQIIGMTNFPEYALAKELGLGYVPVSFVTDYDAWRLSEESVNINEIITRVKTNNLYAFEVIKVLTRLSAPSDILQAYCDSSLAMSQLNAVTEQTAAYLGSL